MHPPIVQISLDLTSIEEAVHTATIAVRAGVDWLEAGTPLILAEGLPGVRALRQHFPNYPIVADLKTMDGGYLEVEMMAKAGATHCVVMGVAHPATIPACVQAGRDFGVQIMGDVLAAADKPACARRLQDLGCDYIIVHTGFDERRDVPEKRFALVKGPLAVRPVYLHKQERIQALVCCTMVALLVFALLELLAHRASFVASGQSLLAQFASLAVLILVLHDGSVLRRVTGLAPPLPAILHTLGFPPADRYALRQV